MDKVFFHYDKATSHTFNLSTRYLNQLKTELGISYIDKKNIPDGSPLDFFGFGYLKQKLGKRKARTIAGVWKLSQEVWSGINLEMIRKVFDSWKRRLHLISARNGEHIEHTKAIHRRRIQKL